MLNDWRALGIPKKVERGREVEREREREGEEGGVEREKERQREPPSVEMRLFRVKGGG